MAKIKRWTYDNGIQGLQIRENLELKSVEDEISKRIQKQLKDFADQNPEIKPKDDPKNKNDRPSY